MDQLFVAEQWFSRWTNGTSTYMIDASLIEKAISLGQNDDKSVVCEWIDNIEEHCEELGISITMLSELAREHGTFIQGTTYNYDDVDTEQGLSVETEENLYGIGTTKEAAKAALLRLLANDLDEGGW